jgi:23S rRNA (cytosine1962-C5)-methyltransferase
VTLDRFVRGRRWSAPGPNVALNGFDPGRAEFLDADVNASLRRFVEAGRQFDAIVLDPPKLRAHRGARRAGRAGLQGHQTGLGLKLLAPGGLLFTFLLLRRHLGRPVPTRSWPSAAPTAVVDGYIADHLGAAPDHPMTLAFPEGEYLKGLVVIRKIGRGSSMTRVNAKAAKGRSKPQKSH